MTTSTNDDTSITATATDPRYFSTLLVFTNVAGVLKHHWEQAGISFRYATQLNAPSATNTATPSVDASTAFANAGGIEAATPSAFDFDTTAVQSSDTVLHAFAVYDDTGTGAAVLVNATTRTLNINGVTQERAAIVLTRVSSGAAFALNTTNIPSGKTLAIKIWGLVQ